MGELDLNKKDWQDCRAAAVAQIRNCKAQLIVYETQLKAAEAEIAKFPVEAPETTQQSAATSG